jgi:signal transduction histidine kinase
LAIADRIVKAHGGRMVIQSAANRGTTVSVALPIAHEGHGKMRSDR